MAQILVIDDDDVQRMAIVHILRNQGYDVLDTASGQTALRMLNEQAVPLVVTDILMPDFDGIELIRKMRHSHAGSKIIAMSSGGWADPDQFLGMAQRLGADATFAKPFRWDEFLGTIGRFLEPRKTSGPSP